MQICDLTAIICLITLHDANFRQFAFRQLKTHLFCLTSNRHKSVNDGLYNLLVFSPLNVPILSQVATFNSVYTSILYSKFPWPRVGLLQ